MGSMALLDRSEFLRLFSGIYESSPWVAETVFDGCDLSGVDRPTGLADDMARVVAQSGKDRQLALVRAHPELAIRPGEGEKLTSYSESEQTGAGLTELGDDERDDFARLNRLYREKFGFPFIIAVRGLDRAAILSSMSERLENDVEAEFREALRQIDRIAFFRLESLDSEFEPSR
ncbi:MAG: 2-oxo-4-hydroxy-4-carboxy-5-ureidoimidazoline decarboxylase [Rhodobacteraceae bacterium]|nr:2-oxo-4-hydroxy-4-carboxy-5-ureidoimidazoline decarboxylase [Paracoccaceae bacterium]MCY4140058.1 2-oxo-4-hydroxy-4-carboxy-5-ureidoimidazoline decarboxylase [Paracoccaceae bacterium]